MTPWHYRWLCQFSYIDLPLTMARRRGQSLAVLSRELLALDEQRALPCGRLSDSDREALRVLAATPELARLTLLDFLNHNSSTGFVAYAFRSPDGGVHCIFRGSERPGCGVPTGVDWLDNFLAPFRGSVQYPEIAAFARRFPDSRVTFSGHSKGAHNALYALAALPNDRASAVAFNGQGFSPGQLTRPQRSRLAAHAVNYVVCGDLVGSLLWHPERRVFVRRQSTDDPHALSSLSFNRRGQPVPGCRPLWSFALEWATRAWTAQNAPSAKLAPAHE